tara:strand:- start:146 stop:403 length:258 start_codon:yes stop_codon:yes gene_type:complete
LKYKKKFHKKRRPKQKQLEGLQVNVYNNNVEGALKVLKKKIKASNLFLDLKKKSFYKKKSERLREKRNLSKLRQKYQTLKEKVNN